MQFQLNFCGHLIVYKTWFIQCFLEESRQLMRLPPRQSTAEADLMVPFQLVSWHEMISNACDYTQ